jgi:hypothetical protein
MSRPPPPPRQNFQTKREARTFLFCCHAMPPLATKHWAESLGATRESAAFHNPNIPLQEVLHTSCGNPPLKKEEDARLSVSPIMYTAAAAPPPTRVLLETTSPSHELDKYHKWSSAAESHMLTTNAREQQSVTG